MSSITRREILTSGGATLLAGLTAGVAGAQENAAAAAKKLKIVVVGAHPDDPESGCGGVIALLADAGHEVVCLYLTRGEAGIPGKSHEEAAQIRTTEAEAACKILGARAIFADQIDGATEVNAQRYDELAAILEAEAPNLVFGHWPVDSHRDHRASALLTYEAWLRAEGKFTLYFFEVMSGTQSQQFTPTHYIDITSVEDRKREACKAHASQHPEGFYTHHDQMNRFRGKEARVKYAEAYVRLGPSATGIDNL